MYNDQAAGRGLNVEEDERIRVAAFYKANEFFYRYMKALTSQ